MDVYHMLGSQGSEPRNESEGRIAGGKSPLSTLLLFLAVHAKIKQQLKKASIPSRVAMIVGPVNIQVPQVHAEREPKRCVTEHHLSPLRQVSAFPFETSLFSHGKAG